MHPTVPGPLFLCLLIFRSDCVIKGIKRLSNIRPLNIRHKPISLGPVDRQYLDTNRMQCKLITSPYSLILSSWSLNSLSVIVNIQRGVIGDRRIKNWRGYGKWPY